jgi:CRP-like cAMP-binding protein
MIAIMSSPLVERLAKLAERDRRLAAGEILFRARDPVRSLFLVASGAMRLVRVLPNGLELTLQHARPGAILAEASLFAERYHCDAVAIEDAVVRIVPLRRLTAALARDGALAHAWAHHLALEVQRARAHAELLSLKRVADRVEAWVALHGPVPAKGRWRQMASEIGVTPEALYRELARRRG